MYFKKYLQSVARDWNLLLLLLHNVIYDRDDQNCLMQVPHDKTQVFDKQIYTNFFIVKSFTFNEKSFW